LGNLTLGFAREWCKVTVDGAYSNDTGSALFTFSVIPPDALAGAIHTPNENVDLGLGIRFGIPEPETDSSGIAGVTIKF